MTLPYPYTYLVGVECSVLGHLLRSAPLVVIGVLLLVLWMIRVRRLP